MKKVISIVVVFHIIWCSTIFCQQENIIEMKAQIECDSLDNLYPDVPYWTFNDSLNQISYKKWYKDLPDCKKYRQFSIKRFNEIPENKRYIVRKLESNPEDTILIGDNIKDFINLAEIRMVANVIEDISTELFSLPAIKSVTIGYSSYLGSSRDNFLHGINKCKSIEFLQLSEITGVESVSPHVLELENLETLRVEGIYSSSLPDKFQKLKKLKELTLSSLDNSEIPSSLKYLTQLEQLTLSGKGISFIPDFISDFENLEYLNISGNIKVLDPNFGYFTKLNGLALNDNKLEKIDNLIDNMIEAGVRNIEYLGFKNNKLKSLPKIISNFEYIYELDLENNGLNSFEIDFSNTGISIIELSNNKLKDIPKSISHSKESDLESPIVYMNNNHLDKLPDWIGEADFPFLYLKNNKIKYFGTELCRKNDLKKVYLDGNPIEDFDTKICNCEKGMLISIIGASKELTKKIREYNNLDTDKVKIVTTEADYKKYENSIRD